MLGRFCSLLFLRAKSTLFLNLNFYWRICLIRQVLILKSFLIPIFGKGKSHSFFTDVSLHFTWWPIPQCSVSHGLFLILTPDSWILITWVFDMVSDIDMIYLKFCKFSIHSQSQLSILLKFSSNFTFTSITLSNVLSCTPNICESGIRRHLP